MENPILKMLSQTNGTAMPNNPLAMLGQFAEFKKQMRGKNPQAIVQGLLSSGKMSQQQFEQLKQQAQSLQSILK